MSGEDILIVAYDITLCSLWKKYEHFEGWRCHFKINSENDVFCVYITIQHSVHTILYSIFIKNVIKI